VIVAASNLYLVSMVAYLIIRLALGASLWWIALLNAFAIYTFFPLVILLPLSALVRQWRPMVRLGLLALLAIIWFGPFFQPTADRKPSGGTVLTVVTFNLRGNKNEDLEAVEAWLRELDADVVALQETPTIYQWDGVASLKDQYPEQETYHIDNLLMSKFPFDLNDDFVGFARVTLDVNGQEVILYPAHLSDPFPNRNVRFGVRGGPLRYLLTYDETRRDQQIDDLLDLVEAETLPYIVAGDLNMSQHSIIYSSLAVEMTDTFRATGVGLGATWPTDAFGPMLRLDYIWVSDAFYALSTERGPNLGSDHLPVVGEVELLPVDQGEDPALESTPEGTAERTPETTETE
jgi:endonuclease/exonuclease/phosphatase (EEP) superfamily protein YafD